MADRNLTVEEILEQYSKKPVKKASEDTFDLDSFLNSVKHTSPSQKTEVIEDVLEIGDNRFVFEPDDAEDKQSEVFEPLSAEPVTPEKTAAAKILGDNTAASAQKPDVSDPKIDAQEKKEFVEPTLPDIEIRQGSGTTFGTQAIDKVLNTHKPEKTDGTEAKSTENNVKKPAVQSIRPVTGKGADTAIMQSLIKLKNERGAPKPQNKKVDPVNRVSINDIDLGIEKKVIPNTEMGIDENASEAEKLAYLNAKRRERVKEFVMKEEEDEKPKGGSVADFESFDQAGEMAEQISSLKSGLVVRFCILLVLGMISAYLTAAYDTSLPLMPILAQSTSYLFVNVILGIIACFVSYTVMSVGLKKLFTLKADSDSLAAVSAIFCLVSSTVMLADSELVQTKTAHVYVAVAIFGLLINTVGKLLIVTRTERNFRYISGGYSKYCALHIDDEDVASRFTKGALSDFPSLSTSRKTEFVTDFIKNSYSADMTDAFSKVYVPIVCGISVLIGVVAFFVFPERLIELPQRIYYALACAAGTMSLCSAMGMMLVANIPLAKASKKYLENSAVMLGYSAVDKFADTNSILIDAVDLFPDGMVDIVNLKPAKKLPIEDGIIYAASLCCQTESILRPAFYKMIRGKTEMLYPVESYIYEDGLGLSGWMENKRVLFGNRALMESHSIEGLPTPEKEAEYSRGDSLVYLSIGGSIAMIFVVKLKASVSVKRALKELEKQRITVILRSVDSLLGIARLSELFEVTPNTFKLLPFRHHADYDAQTSYIAQASSPMIYSGRFDSLAMLLIGTKRLQRSSAVGVAVQTLSALLGIVLAVIFALVGSFGNVFTGTTVMVYCLAWTMITAVIQYVART